MMCTTNANSENWRKPKNAVWIKLAATHKKSAIENVIQLFNSAKRRTQRCAKAMPKRKKAKDAIDAATSNVQM